ncbi:MAG: cell division protein FtsL [Pseudomonadota bacterium]
MMRWLACVALLLGVIVTSIALVSMKHESRQLFISLEAATAEQDAHQMEWSRLQIELAWLGEAHRIEQQAAESLNMREPEQMGVLVRSDG